MDAKVAEEMVEKWGQRFTEGMIVLNRALMEAAKDGVKPYILVHEDSQGLGKDVQMVEVSIMLPPDGLPESAAMIRTFLREIECFDSNWYDEMSGHAVLSQVLQMAAQIKRLEEQVKMLEAKIGEK